MLRNPSKSRRPVRDMEFIVSEQEEWQRLRPLLEGLGGAAGKKQYKGGDNRIEFSKSEFSRIESLLTPSIVLSSVTKLTIFVSSPTRRP